MKILIDARKLGDGGIGVYIENLVDGLLDIQEADPSRGISVSLFTPHPYSAEHSNGESSSSPLHRWEGRVELKPSASKKYSFDEHLLFAKRERDFINEHDLYHSPHYTLPFSLEIPSVVTIHDIIHVSHPESFAHRLIGGGLIRSAMKRASSIITVSVSSEQRLTELMPRLDTPIHVIPNALRGEMRVLDEQQSMDLLRRFRIEGGYALFVGSERPHKGFEQLLEAWKEITADETLKPSKLFVVGKEFGSETWEMVSEFHLSEHVEFLGEVSPQELCALYNQAAFTVLASREEGFGLVALEALACGCPVVSTPVDSVREVCGDSVWYTECFSADSIASLLRELLAESQVLFSNRDAGLRRAALYTIDDVAERTLQVYEKVTGQYYAAPYLEREASVG